MGVGFGTHLDGHELQGQAESDEPVGCNPGGFCREHGTLRNVRVSGEQESLAHHNWVFFHSGDGCCPWLHRRI